MKVKIKQKEYGVDDRLVDIYKKYYDTDLSKGQYGDIPDFLEKDVKFLRDITKHYSKIRQNIIKDIEEYEGGLGFIDGSEDISLDGVRDIIEMINKRYSNEDT